MSERGGGRFGWREIICLTVLATSLLGAIFAPWIASQDPYAAVAGDRLSGLWTDGHLLGTDSIGRDTLSRVLHSGRIAWTVAALVVVISVGCGALLGLVAGFYGGAVDSVISRIADGFLAFPPLLLALVLAAIMGPGTTTSTIALGIVFIPLVIHVTRAGATSERGLGYVAASRGLGHRETYTLATHVTPNVLPLIVVAATVIGSRAMILEASLSFLGVGTQAPTPSWGLMITEHRQMILSHPVTVVVPAVVLCLTVLAINLLADMLADRLDPRSDLRSAVETAA